MASPIIPIHDQKVVNLLRSKMLQEIQSNSNPFRILPSEPLTRKERVVLRLRNYIDRFRRAWLVLRRDYELER